jgi:hypothetical protein
LCPPPFEVFIPNVNFEFADNYIKYTGADYPLYSLMTIAMSGLNAPQLSKNRHAE